jgi:hypothetical protein
MTLRRAVILLSVLSLLGAACGARSTATTATLAELENDVQRRDSAAADWQAAASGDQVRTGGGVRTGAEAQARVDLSDGTLIRLAASTEFTLSTLPTADSPQAQLTLTAGKVWTFVSDTLTSHFEIQTPVGVATVRGSYLSGQYFPDTGKFSVNCLEGQCRLTGTSGKFVDLGSGQKSLIPGPGKDPAPPQPMDAGDIADWTQHFPESKRYQVTPTPSGPGGSGSAGQTACDHAYFPMRAGSSWTYSSANGPMTWTVTDVQGDTESASADMSWSMSSLSGTYHWQCDPSGLVSYQFGSLSSSEFGAIGNYTVTDHSGVFFPAADLLQPGYAWNSNYGLSYEFTAGGQTVPTIATAAESFTVAGTDPVTVGGQTVDGVQIEHSLEMDIQINMPGMTVPATHLSDSGTIVLGRGVGMVRWTNSAGGGSTIELTSYYIP